MELWRHHIHADQMRLLLQHIPFTEPVDHVVDWLQLVVPHYENSQYNITGQGAIDQDKFW